MKIKDLLNDTISKAENTLLFAEQMEELPILDIEDKSFLLKLNNSEKYNDIDLSKLTNIIKKLATIKDNPQKIFLLNFTLGFYMNKLQEDYHYSPVYPIQLLPLPKSVIKNWGFSYASIVVKMQNELKQYQQDSALCYTRFQNISENQWSQIKSQFANEINLYNSELKRNGNSNSSIPQEFRNIINSFRAEYDNEAKKLHNCLKTANNIKSIYKIIAFVLLVTITVIIWKLFS